MIKIDDLKNNKFRIIEEKILAKKWSALKEYVLDYQKKNGSTETQYREVYENGDGACVVLHDVEKDELILVRQFRIPLALKNAEQPMSIEACAGHIEDLSPDEAIKKEILEEVGYQVDEVEFLFKAFATPGAVMEEVHCFYAQVNDEQRITQGGGVSTEQEEIEVLHVPVRTAYDWIAEGHIKDLKTIASMSFLRSRLLKI